MLGHDNYINYILIIWFELKHLSPSDLFFFRYVTQFDINIGVTQQTSSLLYNNRSDILLFIVFICSSEVGTLVYNDLYLCS